MAAVMTISTAIIEGITITMIMVTATMTMIMMTTITNRREKQAK